MANKQSETKLLLSSREVGTLLGISYKTVIRLAEDGEIPSYKIGNAWKFKRTDIDEYLEAHRYQPGSKNEKKIDD